MQMTTQILLLWWKDKFCKIELKEHAISHKLRILRFQSFNFMDLIFLLRGQDLTKNIVSLFKKDNDWLSIVSLCELSLCQVPCSVISILQNFSFHQTNKIWWFVPYHETFIFHNSTKTLEHFSCWALLCQYWQIWNNDKCYNQPVCNVTTNLAATLRLSWP